MGARDQWNYLLQAKEDVLLAESAQDGQEGEAAAGDAASPRLRATKRRVLAAGAASSVQ